MAVTIATGTATMMAMVTTASAVMARHGLERQHALRSGSAAGDFELTSTVTAPEATEGVSSGLEVIMVGLWLSLGYGERAGFGAWVAIESDLTDAACRLRLAGHTGSTGLCACSAARALWSSHCDIDPTAHSLFADPLSHNTHVARRLDRHARAVLQGLRRPKRSSQF